MMATNATVSRIPLARSIGDAEYRSICDLVYAHSRISLGPNKKELVMARIGQRLRHLGFGGFGEYSHFLRSAVGQAELGELIDAISTNHTSFFRDIGHFDFLRNQILPSLDLKSRAGQRKFRVWSAACSSGEEAYSIAFCLADFFARVEGWTWEVIATDISRRMLGAAQAGIYESEHVRLPRNEWLRRYFQKGVNSYEGCFRVKQEIRDCIRFMHLNLFQRPYPFEPGFHVVFCRNVMIYFDRISQEQLVRQINSMLKPGAFLLIGPSESLIGVNHGLHYVRASVYQRATP